jgi:hypothetical protein
LKQKLATSVTSFSQTKGDIDHGSTGQKLKTETLILLRTRLRRDPPSLIYGAAGKKPQRQRRSKGYV